jgi:hypothetical protein
VGQILGDRPHVAVAMDQAGRPPMLQVLHALGVSSTSTGSRVRRPMGRPPGWSMEVMPGLRSSPRGCRGSPRSPGLPSRDPRCRRRRRTSLAALRPPSRPGPSASHRRRRRRRRVPRRARHPCPLRCPAARELSPRHPRPGSRCPATARRSWASSSSSCSASWRRSRS